jgi:hypothetical protein
MPPVVLHCNLGSSGVRAPTRTPSAERPPSNAVRSKYFAFEIVEMQNILIELEYFRFQGLFTVEIGLSRD